MDTLGEFADHVAWMRASFEWFLAQDRSGFDIPVENCPGWDVGNVSDHAGQGVLLLVRLSQRRLPRVVGRDRDRGPSLRRGRCPWIRARM